MRLTSCQTLSALPTSLIDVTLWCRVRKQGYKRLKNLLKVADPATIKMELKKAEPVSESTAHNHSAVGPLTVTLW